LFLLVCRLEMMPTNNPGYSSLLDIIPKQMRSEKMQFEQQRFRSLDLINGARPCCPASMEIAVQFAPLYSAAAIISRLY
jgi:hypothetical protein